MTADLLVRDATQAEHPGRSTPDTLTVLRCDNRHVAAKRFLADGSVLPYDAGSRFSHEVVPVTDIVSLAAALQAIEGDPRAFVIRGSLNPDIDPTGLVYRRKRAANGLPGFFRAEPRPWLMIDIDKLDAPEGIDPTSRDAVEYAVRQLPAAFHDVTVFHAFSSSAGLRGPTIKLHLWLWLDRPVDDQTLRRWGVAWNREVGHQVVDPALFDAIQVHYTAHPIFEGRDDPLPQRSGLIRKGRDVVDLIVRTTQAPSLAWSASTPMALEVDEEGLLIDGREGWLLRERRRILLGLEPKTFDDFVGHVWDSFRANCVLTPTNHSPNSYSLETIVTKCLADWAKWEAGEFPGQVTKKKVEPSFKLQPVDLETGIARLREAVWSFFSDPRDMAIRITSGSGKTHQVCCAIAETHLPGRVIHVYVPQHRLGDEIAVKLKQLRPDLRVKVIRGRRVENCLRSNLVDEFAKIGVPIQRTLCDARRADGTGPVCPHFAECAYQAQFTERSDVYIFAHQYLSKALHDGVPAADLNVIDEAFFGTLVERETILLSEIAHSAVAVRAGMPVVDEAIRVGIVGDAPLLKHLRTSGVTPDQLDEEALRLHDLWRSEVFTSVKPSDKLDYLLRKAQNLPRFPTKCHLYRLLSDELRSDREKSNAIALVEDEIAIRWLQDHRLNAPTLVLDATADPKILEAVLGEVEFHDIQIRRNAKVTQVWDRRMSKFSFLHDEKRQNHLAEVQIALSRLAARHRRGLVVTFKKVREHLVVPDGWAIEHYGAVRGLDHYKDFDAVVLVGTYLPPTLAVEGTAAALFRGAKLTLTGEYVDTDRGYVLGDGPAGVSVRCHPDPLVQIVLEQQREAEMLQAIDRIRLIHGANPKHVYILSSLPLEIEVDELIRLDELSGLPLLPELLRRFARVVPLRRDWLFANAPDLFASEEQAREFAEALMGKSPIIYIGDFPIYFGTYRLHGQPGRASRFLYRAATPSVRSTLVALVGELTSYTGPPDLGSIEYEQMAFGGRTEWQVVYASPREDGLKPILMPPDIHRALNPPLLMVTRT